jgi:hypothetical protein
VAVAVPFNSADMELMAASDCHPVGGEWVVEWVVGTY